MGFEGMKDNFEVNTEVHWKPVELLKDGGDVVERGGFGR